jgi:hypothetical protein
VNQLGPIVAEHDLADRSFGQLDQHHIRLALGPSSPSLLVQPETGEAERQYDPKRGHG